MQYKKINLELIVPVKEADAVEAELAAALDVMEVQHTLFGGRTETVLIEHPGSRRKSALINALDASKTTLGAIKTARKHATSALHRVV
jgi:hypothetical protein